MRSRTELAEITWSAACHHEAAHAAVAVAFQFPIDCIRLGIRNQVFGAVEPEGGMELIEGTDSDDEEAVSQSIVMSLAGPEAEAHCLSSYGLRRGRVQSIVAVHASGDMENVQARLEDLGHVDRRLIRRLEQEAAAMVSDAWGSVVDIAEALSDNNGYLTGSQIYEIA